MKQEITASVLRRLFAYEPITGVFTSRGVTGRRPTRRCTPRIQAATVGFVSDQISVVGKLGSRSLAKKSILANFQQKTLLLRRIKVQQSVLEAIS